MMKQVKVIPARQRVVIAPFEQQESKTASGIIIPKGAEENRPEMGKVIGVGFGDEERPMEYHVGQTVCYSQYAGLDVKLNIYQHGEKVYKVMNQADIMMVVEEVQQ